MQTKICTKCKRELPLSEFSENVGYRDGIRHIAKNALGKSLGNGMFEIGCRRIKNTGACSRKRRTLRWSCRRQWRYLAVGKCFT